MSRTTTGSQQVSRQEPERRTAEELLHALRRSRPVREIIPPASALASSAQRPRRALWPEGYALVDQPGRLTRTGRWWTFVFDPAESYPPTKLLPNADLEVMVRTVRGSAQPIKFLISGEMTVFQNENYLLIRAARRAVSANPGKEPSPGTSGGGEAAANAPPVNENREEPPPPAPVPVDQVLAALERQAPTDTLTPVPSRIPEPGVTGRAGPGVMVEGSAVVRRPGRLIRDGDWWTFVFESDHPDYPEPPIKLLPNSSVELMVNATEQDGGGVVFLITGDVTLFAGENYLLPRIVIRRIDTGNLTK